MEYQNVNFNQVYSEDPTANLSNSFQYTNQGLQYTQQMLAQNQKVEIQEAGADYRFAGSVLETVAPFLQKKIDDNIQKRITDGLETYKHTVSEAKEEGIAHWKANINKLALEGQALEDAGDRWWEENKEERVANDVRKSFQKQGWGYAWGHKKGELIDHARKYNLDVPSVKMAKDGVDYDAAVAAEERKFLASLGNVNHDMFGAIVQPIMEKTEQASFKNWKAVNTKEMLASDQSKELKAFHDSLLTGDDAGQAWNQLVSRSRIHVGGSTKQVNGKTVYVGGSIPAAKEYAYNVVMSGVDNGSINRDIFNKLGLSKTKNLSDGQESTIRKILGEKKWSALKTVLREKEKKAWQADKDSDKIASYESESTELDRYKASADGTPAELQMTKNNLRNSIIAHNKNHSYEPERLKEELAQLELEETISKAKITDYYTTLYDTGKYTIEQHENAPNFIKHDEKWKEKAEHTDATWRGDKQVIDELLTGDLVARYQKNGVVSDEYKTIKRGITETFRRVLKEERQGGKLEENETIEQYNNRTRLVAQKKLQDFLKEHLRAGVKLKDAAKKFRKPLEGESVINQQVKSSQEARNTIAKIKKFQNAGAGDVSNWTPDEIFGDDHNGVISGTRVQLALDQNVSEEGISVLGRAGPNIGGRLKVTQDFQKDPLIQLIAKETKDSYWGALNKLAVAFKKTPLKLPNSIITAESLPPEQLQQLQKGLQYENPYQIDRAWGEGNKGGVGWEQDITPYKAEIQAAAKAHGLANEGEIAAWTELIEENKELLNTDLNADGVTLGTALEKFRIDVRRKQFKFEKDPQKKQNALNGTIHNGITQ